MSKKPYIYEGFEWLEIMRKKSWTDASINPDDLQEYSEFAKPYQSEDGKNSYPSWEWSWPTMTWPPIDGITYPDPVENPCSIDENCVWAGIMGPDKIDCGECFTWSQAHLWLGCDIAPWWAAYGKWTLSNGVDGECYLLFSGPVMATICCSDNAVGQNLILRYEGPLDCQGQVEVLVTCAQCCDESMELTGGDTVTSGNVWTGTISPACPDAECSVISNSGCTLTCDLNAAGSQVTVGTDAGDCGSFAVTVSQDLAGCASVTTSKTVRMSAGAWNACNTKTLGGTHQCWGTEWMSGQYKATISCGTGGFGFLNARDCDENIIHQFEYLTDCCDTCGTCFAQHFTRAYTSLIWSCTC